MRYKFVISLQKFWAYVLQIVRIIILFFIFYLSKAYHLHSTHPQEEFPRFSLKFHIIILCRCHINKYISNIFCINNYYSCSSFNITVRICGPASSQIDRSDPNRIYLSRLEEIQGALEYTPLFAATAAHLLRIIRVHPGRLLQ